MARHNITLIYNAAENKVESKETGFKTQSGDEIVFDCAAGPVRILMIPNDRFSAAEFRTGDDPVVVNTDNNFSYCCGVVVDGHVVGYPAHRNFGNNQEGTGGGDAPPPG